MNIRLLFSTAAALAALAFALPVLADKNWCHGLHACSSDSGSYICGDTGRCDFCPDNEYCIDQKRRVAPDHTPSDALVLYLPRADTTPGVLNPDVTETNLVDTV